MNEYFQHDFYARNDEKIEELIDKHGLAGYGAFWIIVEMMHEHRGKMPVKRLQSIADLYHVPIEMLEDIVDRFDLFHIEGAKIVSDRIKKNFEARAETSERMRKLVQTRWSKTGI